MNLPSQSKPTHITLRISQPWFLQHSKTRVWDSQCTTFPAKSGASHNALLSRAKLWLGTMHWFPSNSWGLGSQCIPFPAKTRAWDFQEKKKKGVWDSECIPVPSKTRARVWDSLCTKSPAKLGFGTYNALLYHAKLGLGTMHYFPTKLRVWDSQCIPFQAKTWPWDSQCINFQAKTRASKPRAWDHNA